MEEQQKQLQQNLYMLEVYKAQMENLATQSELVENSLLDFMQTKETLTKIKELNESSEFLIPIGANTFVFGKITDNKKVITSIGSNVSVEENIEKVIQRIEDKIKEFEDLSEKIAQEMQKIQNKFSELRQKTQEMYSR